MSLKNAGSRDIKLKVEDLWGYKCTFENIIITFDEDGSKKSRKYVRFVFKINKKKQ